MDDTSHGVITFRDGTAGNSPEPLSLEKSYDILTGPARTSNHTSCLYFLPHRLRKLGLTFLSFYRTIVGNRSLWRWQAIAEVAYEPRFKTGKYMLLLGIFNEKLAQFLQIFR